MKSIKITTIILALIATFASCKKDVINSTPTSSINYYASSEYAKKN